MKDVRAQLRFLRMAPRKVRLVVDTVRGMTADDAERTLTFNRRRASGPVLKLLRSAIANAENNFKLDRKTLFIKRITADGGPTIKRYRPRAFGSAAPILKRSSHILLILGQNETKKPAKEDAKNLKRTNEAHTMKPSKAPTKTEQAERQAKQKKARVSQSKNTA